MSDVGCAISDLEYPESSDINRYIRNPKSEIRNPKLKMCPIVPIVVNKSKIAHPKSEIEPH
jgi:hypothetical protein